MNTGIAQISGNPPPVAGQTSNVTSVAPGQCLRRNDLCGYLADAVCLICLAMVPIEELYGVGQRRARWKILNRPSRFVDLRWAKSEGRSAETLLECQHRTGFRLLFLSTTEYPIPRIG